jgi:hypothetical protein
MHHVRHFCLCGFQRGYRRHPSPRHLVKSPKRSPDYHISPTPPLNTSDFLSQHPRLSLSINDSLLAPTTFSPAVATITTSHTAYHSIPTSKILYSDHWTSIKDPRHFHKRPQRHPTRTGQSPYQRRQHSRCRTARTTSTSVSTRATLMNSRSNLFGEYFLFFLGGSHTSCCLRRL